MSADGATASAECSGTSQQGRLLASKSLRGLVAVQTVGAASRWKHCPDFKMAFMMTASLRATTPAARFKPIRARSFSDAGFLASQYLQPSEIALVCTCRDCHWARLIAVEALVGIVVRHDAMGIGINCALIIVADKSAVPRAGGHGRESLEVCVSEVAHAFFRYVQASKRPATLWPADCGPQSIPGRRGRHFRSCGWP